MALKLNKKLDAKAAAKEYKKAGRVRLTDVLDKASAETMFGLLRDHCIWDWTYRDGTKLKKISGRELNDKIQRRQREFYDKVYSQARNNSQHLFFTCPLTFNRDGVEPPPLTEVETFFKSDEFRDLIRQIAGRKDGDLIDTQARWFNRDQFQTDNFDWIDESDNALMFDLSLAAGWRTDWGGLLQFLDGDGNIEEVWQAGFNSLDVIALPCRRAVSYVPPYMGSFHLGVTGEMD